MIKYCCLCGGMGHYAYQCRWPIEVAAITPRPEPQYYVMVLTDEHPEGIRYEDLVKQPTMGGHVVP